jgi:hypothetical protein
MAHNLKIAGAVYSSVAKVTFTDSGGTSCAYLDADEVYTKDQAAQLIEDERNKTREYTVTTVDQGITFWEGDEADIAYGSTAPSDTYKLWVELK